MLSSCLSLYQRLVLVHPKWVLGILLLLVIAFSLPLGQLKIDASSEALILEYDEDLDYFRQMTSRYQAGDFLVVTYRPEAPLLSEESLAQLALLRDALAKVDGVKSALSILDVPLLYSPKVSLTALSDGLKTLKDADPQLALEEFRHSPIYRDTLVGEDGKTTAILLQLTVDETYIRLVRERDRLRLLRDTQGLSASEQARLVAVSDEFLAWRTQATALSHARIAQIRQVLHPFKDRAQVFLGGASMIAADMVDFVRSDMVVFGVGVLLLIVAVLAVIFRHWLFVILPLLTALVSTVIMLGLLALFDWRLTVISSNFVALLLILCLMMSIHLLVRYREAIADTPDASPRAWVMCMLSHMVKPCLYTVLTTVVAFASLVVSGIRPVIDFGWMMVLGLHVAFIVSFLLIPAGLMVFSPPKVATVRSTPPITLWFSHVTQNYGVFVWLLSALAVAISIVGIQRLEVENRFIDYFHQSTEIHQGMLVIDQQLGGTITLDIVLEHTKAPVDAKVLSADEDPFAEDPFAQEDAFGDDPFAGEQSKPSYWLTQAGMQKILQLQQYLESLPEVGKVQSLAMIYQVATDLAGRQLSDFELAIMRQSLPQELSDVLVRPYLSEEFNEARLSLRVKETDPNLRRGQLIEQVRDYMTKEMGLAPEDVHVNGMLVLYNNLLQSLFRSQILTIGAVFVGILVMFILLFRSLPLALIALTPNMLAACMVLGGMGLAGVPLDMMTITIAAIAVGIGVDDAIHYIYRFREEFAKDGDYIATMHRAHASIGRAMYYTSVTVVAGFSILALSAFIPSIYFGLLTALAMLAAIVSSLTLLPKLLVLIKPL